MRMQEPRLRVLKWLSTVPAVGVCTVCNRLFKVPLTAMKSLRAMATLAIFRPRRIERLGLHITNCTCPNGGPRGRTSKVPGTPPLDGLEVATVDLLK
jgi:hypothetical protein